MDPEVSVLLHCSAWRGLLEAQVQVELSERFNRQTDPALERHIEEVWAERVSKEPWLFNGAKFRLHSFSLASPGSPPSPSVCPSLKCPPGSLSPQRPRLDCAGNKHAQDKHSSPKGEENLYDSDSTVLVMHEAAQDSFQTVNRLAHQQEKGDCAAHSHCCPASSEQKQITMVKASSTSGHNASKDITADLPSWPDNNINLREASPLLTLRLGLTCYKDFLGTNWSCRVEELRKRGEAEFGESLALLAQPLGVGGVLCTFDGQVVLIRRSQKVAEAGGLLDIPGGHPEPKAVCQGQGEDQICITMLQQRQGAVVSELFSSVCAEIRDEVNVPLSSLGEPVLMGIALNHTSSGRPSAEFYVSCSLTSDEVRKLYWQGGVEAHESTDIVFLSRTLDINTPLWSELCPSAKGAVLLYQQVMPDRSSPSPTEGTTPENGSR
ncbi:uridine diphosphate glucose pyrophosphatase NUDT22 isoform 2-T3 [Polymixia lowei]